MRIIIAGGSGLLGKALAERLHLDHDIVILSRRPGAAPEAGIREVAWTADGTVGAWAHEVDEADVVVNLAGAGIADKPWTPARKALLRSSRVDSTRSLVAAVAAAAPRPRVFVQGSAVGYYGATLSDAPHDETASAGDDFLADLASEWEHEAAPVATHDSRLIVVRTGIALSAHGGALPQMARPFRFFAGGRLGSGRQYLSWITVDDWVSLVAWAIATPEVHGVLNGCAPQALTNAAFSTALARSLHRPNLVPAPAMALRLLLGEMAESLLLLGQRVVPARAQALGFVFAHPEIDDALTHVWREPQP